MPRTTSFDETEIAWTASGTGEPLLLIAGQGVDSASWQPLIRTLARDHRVVYFDHAAPATAPSATPPATPPGPSRAMRSQFSTPPASTGHTCTGIRWAGGSHNGWPSTRRTASARSSSEPPPRATARAAGPRSSQTSEDLASGDPDRLARIYFSDPATAEHHTILDRDRTHPRARRLHYSASRNHDTWALLGQIHAPTLVLHGDHDAITPWSNGEQLALGIPHATFQLIADGSHGYHLGTPRRGRNGDRLPQHPFALPRRLDDDMTRRRDRPDVPGRRDPGTPVGRDLHRSTAPREQESRDVPSPTPASAQPPVANGSTNSTQGRDQPG